MREIQSDHVEQWFLTFYDRRTPKIINAVYGPLNIQIDFKKLTLKEHNFTFMNSIDPRDPLHGPLGIQGPRLRTYDVVFLNLVR